MAGQDNIGCTLATSVSLDCFITRAPPIALANFLRSLMICHCSARFVDIAFADMMNSLFPQKASVYFILAECYLLPHCCRGFFADALNDAAILRSTGAYSSPTCHRRGGGA